MRAKFDTDARDASNLADLHGILEPSAHPRRLLDAFSPLGAERGADDVVRAVIPALQ